MFTLQTINNFSVYNGEREFIFYNPLEFIQYLKTLSGVAYIPQEELHRLSAYLLNLREKLFLNGNRDIIFSLKLVNLKISPIEIVIPYNCQERKIIGKSTNQVIADFNAISEIQKLINPVKLQDSTPGTAFHLLSGFCKQYDIKLEKPIESIHRICRKAYYGGRTEIFNKIGVNGIAMDINSSYLSSFTEKFPVGKMTTGNTLTEFSIVMAEIEVPDFNHIGILPYRLKSKHALDRLYFPVGKWTGYFTGIELQNAVNYGVIIHKILWSANWESGDYLFQGFGNLLYNARYDTEDIYKRYFKLLGNSLAGKLAQDYNAYRVRIGKPAKGWFKVADLSNVWARPMQYNPPSAFYHHASFITSYARIKLLKSLKESRNIVYCDTDSIFCEQFSGEEGTGLGEWKRVCRYEQILIHTGKQYAYKDINSEKWKHTAHFENVETFMKYFRGEVNLAPSEKKLVELAHNREILPDGNTVPYNVEQLKRSV